MPLITVILPALNAEKFIHQSVVTTLRSLPKDSQLIVIDDGSTDGTAGILHRIEDSRLVIVHHTSKAGLSRTLNEGLGLTDSKYVARMDADDMAMRWRFPRQIAELESRASDLLFSPVVYISSNGRILRPSVPYPVRDAAGLSLLLGNSFVHPTMIARRLTIEKLGGYRDVRAEDYELWLRAHASGAKITSSSLPTIWYRKHESQVSSSAAWKAAALAESTSGTMVDSYASVYEMHLGQAPKDLEALVSSVLRLAPNRAAMQLPDRVEAASKELMLGRRERLHLAARLSSLRAFLEAART